MRKSSPETCCVRLCSQMKLTDATMQPHSMTPAAIPRNPAVILRRSEEHGTDAGFCFSTVTHFLKMGNLSPHFYEKKL